MHEKYSQTIQQYKGLKIKKDIQNILHFYKTLNWKVKSVVIIQRSLTHSVILESKLPIHNLRLSNSTSASSGGGGKSAEEI